MIKESFRKYLEEAIGADNALVAFSAFDEPASVSVRLNPFKKQPGEAGGLPVPWSRWGRVLESRPSFTLDPHLHAGAYYVQDSSSMFVGEMFRRCLSALAGGGRRVRVLDLCAAPGGKTTDLAASLREMCGDDFLLVANEVMAQRAGVLASNVALWGDPNVVVTSEDPRSFARYAGFFDIVVADVPCSGEGMFRKDESARKQWSEDNVALCAARQRRIVADVWPSLSDGGFFIYSTCTFNVHENGDNVGWIAEELGAEPVLTDDGVMYEGIVREGSGYSLVPGLVPGEGQYCAALKKNVGCGDAFRMSRSGDFRKSVPVAMQQEIRNLFSVPVVLRQRGDTVIAIPEAICEDVACIESGLRVISAGCAAGVVKGKDFVPDADLALSLVLRKDAFPVVEVDKDMALRFLHRDSVRIDGADKGYLLLAFEGNPIGFVKNLGTRCNNLYPQGRRIRMDINKQ